MLQRQLAIKMNADLYKQAKWKCREIFGIGLSPLIKVFLRAFVNERGVGFFIGEEQLRNVFHWWLSKKRAEKDRKGGAWMPGPKLRDLYEI
jgi:hypothetical protein